jgi:uncharacterized membrane protein YphA (DoxX/SURF4 family)
MKSSLHPDVTGHLRARLYLLEEGIVRWLARWSITVLRVGLGAVFLGFGLLKFFPGFSPAEGLVVQTLGVLTFGAVPARAGVFVVAALECAIGLGLIANRFLRISLVLLGFQMVGAMSPLVLFPGELFGGPFHAPTLEGQYVLKDVVLISAGLVIGTTLQGGRIFPGHVGGERGKTTNKN